MLLTPTMNLSMLGTLFVQINNRQSSSQAEEQPRADIPDLETKASSPTKDVMAVGAYPQSSFECRQARPLDFIGFQHLALIYIYVQALRTIRNWWNRRLVTATNEVLESAFMRRRG
ncbi:hypothetical protein BKA82DRAFT_4340101 [Pisolithus tinctorius]|nr:hypothetical protein BKA82DRAFT_4340101 [Pisolithus tinctorius]